MITYHQKLVLIPWLLSLCSNHHYDYFTACVIKKCKSNALLSTRAPMCCRRPTAIQCAAGNTYRQALGGTHIYSTYGRTDSWADGRHVYTPFPLHTDPDSKAQDGRAE